jgi:copper transport protein
VRRAIAFLIALFAALVSASAAFAHASLVRAEPADGMILAETPAALRLTFNEPVTPLVMRLVAPDGSVRTVEAAAENATITVKPGGLKRGTHLLSWRVTSADGHPVGGSLTFSVGEASAPPVAGTLPASDPLMRGVLWAAKLVVYVVLLAGIGGAFARMWLLTGTPPWLDRVLVALIAAGLVVTPLSTGLQGLDALDLKLPALAQQLTWETGLATSYGLTAIALMGAQFAALLSFPVALRRANAVARALSLTALLGAGFALALSGHASNAAPQWLTRPSVFVHVVCVVFWIGALLPLIAATRAGEGGAFGHFSRLIPYPLLALVVSGAILAVVQLDRVDALWTTNYGIVLSAKLAGVALLLALGALNRYALVPRYVSGDATASGPLTRTMAVELVVVGVILALVATWRFTPPPRALAASEPVEIHLHGERAMAQVSMMPVRARDTHVDIELLDDDLNILKVQEVTLTLANPGAGIEPVRRIAIRLRDGHWSVDGLRIPVAGQWVVRVDLLINDFEKIVLEDKVDLPRLP